ncbi:MAG: tandem-95 repeat protein [Calothrix sp. CSU_2_0]|nr:tandem-95 repeat protein [Calothrix sp. CSU_2_0]
MRPFTANAFATGIPTSNGNIGAMAIAILDDGTILASGGANRGSIYRFNSLGGTATTPLITLPQPIYDMAVDRNDSIWATTGGGSLLQLNPTSGQIVKQYGESITQAIAINSTTGLIYVSSGNGIEIFDPVKETFTHYSDIRVDSLAFDNSGNLWGTSWPDRGLVVRFDSKGRAQQMLSSSYPIDSLAFGAANSRLAGLGFISTNSGDVLMVDLATMQYVKVATGKTGAFQVHQFGGTETDTANWFTTWGENIEVTKDGRILIAHSRQIDVLNPTVAPKVAATNPVKDAIIALPLNTINVTFDSDMFVGGSSDLASVLNPNNYQLIGSKAINPVSVSYNAATKSASLGFNSFDAGNYEFKVLQSIKSGAGVELETAYSERFTTISNFSSLVDFNFSNARSDRANNTVSFDVTITSKANQDLLLPVMLLLDPSNSFTGVPQGTIGRNQTGAYLLDLQDSLPDGRLKPGASTTTRTITVNNPDALRVEFTPDIYAMPYPNQAPVITSTALTTATVGQQYNYQVTANDPDGTVLGYLLYDAPTGMQVDASGLISWTPVAGSANQENVVLYTYDLRGGYTTQSFAIAVLGANNKPIFSNPSVTGGTVEEGGRRGGGEGGNSSSSSPTPPLSPSPTLLIRATEGKTLQLKVAATDTDRDKLTYWADNLPGGSVFDPSTGILTWTPNFNQAGTYENIQFVVNDGKERVTQTINILVAQSNQAPTLTKPADIVVREGEFARIQLKATDADGTGLTYFSNLLPGGATLDPTTGLFTWTPAYFQAGEFEVPFSVSDGETITTQTTKIIVLNVNAAPVFEGLTGWEAQEGESIRLRAFGFDPDNPGFVPQERNGKGELTILEGSDPSVTYTVSGLPSGASFDAETAMFTWKPGYDKAGVYNVTFTATDDGNGTGVGKTTSIVVPITIRNTNRTPLFDNVSIAGTGIATPETATITSFNPDGTFTVNKQAFANVDVKRGEVKEITFKVIDLEGDNLQLNLQLERNAGDGIPSFIKPLRNNNDGTWTLRVEPGFDAFGENYSFKLVATEVRSDGTTALKNELPFNVNILATNNAPVIGYVGDKVAVIGQPLEFLVNTADRDQDSLQYSITGLPAGTNATLTPTGIYGQSKFTWTPTAENIGTYNISIKVVDSGNNGLGDALEDTETFKINVRTSNNAPVLGTLGNRTIAEGETLSLQLAATDVDGDGITYSAGNLPVGAVLDAKTGLLRWTPDYSQAGIYNGIEIIASDGNKSITQSLGITVNNTNQAPIFTPLAVQYGQENDKVTFKLVADDADRAGVEYTAVGTLPPGAILNSATGEFTWKPNYTQAGEHILKFAAKDPQGATALLDVVVRIANVNRAPSLTVSDRAVVLGETLSFQLKAIDPDILPLSPTPPLSPSSLKYTATNLPEGAILDAATGQFDWKPSPGQVGNYSVTFNVSDGEIITTATALVRVALSAVPPTVALDLTPSFPAVPGQKVVVQTTAAGLAAITSLTATVAGQAVTLDTFGRFSFVPNTPGKVVVEAVATDADGRVGRTTTVVKVRDVNDADAPVVSFAAGLDGSKVTGTTNITGTIADTNLDEWVLEVAELGSNNWNAIARGNQAVTGNLATLDAGKYENGFYQLRLTATDISDRTTTKESVIEVSGITKPSAYIRKETDLTTTIGGVNLNLVRSYNSLNAGEVGAFGNGWSLANIDANIQTNVAKDAPFRTGTRLYVTAPNGERVGFTFAPTKVTIPGATYYTPAWVADGGVGYTLESVDSKLIQSGSSFYDMRTGFAYNPGSGRFDGYEYKLIANDGNVYYLSSKKGVVEQVAANGTRLVYSDSGITSSTGETIRFVKDAQGRLEQVTAPDGTLIRYTYEGDNLVAARNLSTGNASRYGYTDSLLSLASGNPGTPGSAIAYSTNTPQISTIKADLGGAVLWNGSTVTGVGNERYTFSLRDGEIESTATGVVLVGVDVTGVVCLPLMG